MKHTPQYKKIFQTLRQEIEAGVYQDGEKLSSESELAARFTTSIMSEILPDIPDAPSGWNTDNHYFYEIVNRSGKSVYIQLAFSSRNATEDFMAMCDRINEHYPSKLQKAEWQWRTLFKTTTVEIGDELTKDVVFAGLDDCMKEIQAFEAELKQKLGM